MSLLKGREDIKLCKNSWRLGNHLRFWAIVILSHLLHKWWTKPKSIILVCSCTFFQGCKYLKCQIWVLVKEVFFFFLPLFFLVKIICRTEREPCIVMKWVTVKREATCTQSYLCSYSMCVNSIVHSWPCV